MRILAVFIFLSLCAITAFAAAKGEGVYYKFLIPAGCNNKDGKCCPGNCNGHGTCKSIYDENVFGQNHLEGMIWLTQNFSQVCVCQPEFTGHGCNECNYGFSGYPTCTRVTTPRVRRNWVNLSTAEKQKYIDGIKLLTTIPADSILTINKWHWHALFHYWVNNAYQNWNWNYAHAGPAFAGWHRLYLLRLERDIQLALNDNSWSFPYFDWRDENSTAGSTNAVLKDLGGNGDITEGECNDMVKGYCNCTVRTGPFANWPCVREDGEIFSNLTRAFLCSLGEELGYPSTKTVNYIFSVPDFHYSQDTTVEMKPSFNGLMEGRHVGPFNLRTWPTVEVDLHNYVHVWIGGIMGASEYAGNEPIFWLHHNFIDSFFDVWWRRATHAGFDPKGWGSVNEKVGHNFNEPLSPFFPITKNSDMFHGSKFFGYTHEWVEAWETAEFPTAFPAPCGNYHPNTLMY